MINIVWRVPARASSRTPLPRPICSDFQEILLAGGSVAGVVFSRSYIAISTNPAGTKFAKLLTCWPPLPGKPPKKDLMMPGLNESTIADPCGAVVSGSLVAERAARATVLLVEDDRSIRRYIEVILQRAGYQVVSAADGLEGMKAALGGAIDAVVTDAIMPHLNGYELCRFLRRHPRFANVPVIFLSGLDRTDPASDESRPDVYLAKPVRPEELTGCIARLLAKAA